MQVAEKETRMSSRKRLDQLNQQQKKLSNIFKIANFYKEEKFDLQGLKQKINEVRLKRNESRQKQYRSISYNKDTHLPENMNRKHIRTRENGDNSKLEHFDRSVNSQYQDNPETRLSSAVKYTNGKNKQPRYQLAFEKQKPSSRLREKNNTATKLEPIVINQPDEKIIIERSQDLAKYEHRIQQLWSLYELLTRIMQGVEKTPFPQELAIIKYVDDVCSDKFQFVLDFLNHIIPRRFHRTIVLSRLLQNIAIVYLTMELHQKKKIRCSHLINFIGFCTSNVVFMIRLLHLGHNLKIEPSRTVIKIIDAIKTFQMDSYKAEIGSIKELVLRMEHNNEIVNILQIRLNTKNSKQCQLCIGQFLKHIERNHQPLFQYGHYIFEFLAYHLNKEKLIGLLPYLEIAPAPYLSFKLPQTLVIQPWGVLIYQKNAKLFIRAHTETFITELAKFCNIVFWTDMMPNQADPLLSVLPDGDNIHYLYRYHCKYEKESHIKIVWRAGCLPDNAIIIDRSLANCPYDQEIAIQMPWKGEKRDTRLLALLEVLAPLFNNGKTLKKQMEGIRSQLRIIKLRKGLPVYRHPRIQLE